MVVRTTAWVASMRARAPPSSTTCSPLRATRTTSSRTRSRPVSSTVTGAIRMPRRQGRMNPPAWPAGSSRCACPRLEEAVVREPLGGLGGDVLVVDLDLDADLGQLFGCQLGRYTVDQRLEGGL